MKLWSYFLGVLEDFNKFCVRIFGIWAKQRHFLLCILDAMVIVNIFPILVVLKMMVFYENAIMNKRKGAVESVKPKGHKPAASVDHAVQTRPVGVLIPPGHLGRIAVT